MHVMHMNETYGLINVVQLFFFLPLKRGHGLNVENGILIGRLYSDLNWSKSLGIGI